MRRYAQKDGWLLMESHSTNTAADFTLVPQNQIGGLSLNELQPCRAYGHLIGWSDGYFVLIKSYPPFTK